jgi:hypothetical protein
MGTLTFLVWTIDFQCVLMLDMKMRSDAYAMTMQCDMRARLYVLFRYAYVAGTCARRAACTYLPAFEVHAVRT